MAILTALKETFEAGDPIIRSWPLVDSHWYPFLLSALYVFAVKRLGPALMENRKPFDLRYLMIVYNFSVVSVYFYSLCVLVFHFLMQFPDSIIMLCTNSQVYTNHYTYQCASVGWYIYILKYIEFADTGFFILRKKNHLITNLHVIHHASLPIMCWIMMRIERSGTQFIPAGINSFIHLIMYTYYGLAAMGPEVQKKLWWKEYLTLLQMAQFVAVIIIMFVIVPLIGCKTSAFGIYMDIVFATLFLVLFSNYYQKTYKKTSNKKTSNGVAHCVSNGVNGVHPKEK